MSRSAREPPACSKLSIILFACVGLILGQSCCREASQEPQSIKVGDLRYPLRPVDKSVPIDLTNVELVGWSERNRDEMAHALGRIAATNLHIKRVDFAWDMAARVSIKGERFDWFLYLSKEPNGMWRFVRWEAYDMQPY